MIQGVFCTTGYTCFQKPSVNVARIMLEDRLSEELDMLDIYSKLYVVFTNFQLYSNMKSVMPLMCRRG